MINLISPEMYPILKDYNVVYNKEQWLKNNKPKKAIVITDKPDNDIICASFFSIVHIPYLKYNLSTVDKLKVGTVSIEPSDTIRWDKWIKQYENFEKKEENSVK